ncbi:NADPH-dependent ferric siderophore reductase [Homoserinimonas aerilata]|uniref:NADPH-dependent ferric siderophore reductase n=1 Tax=Homoserinimonas aerilata TaxID=1162970 RepID=A0A542YHL1_9MICO|nr:siderophore-interacting protein [Homoserinimonas aerilata]TQL47583.1 NADPH-dependent ferric siderophore reductase [Homoserinimonas aerilata]
MLTQTLVEKDARPAFRPYLVSVVSIRRLSPHFVRVTFTGELLDFFGTDRLDQRIKLMFPVEEGPHAGTLSDVGTHDEESVLRGEWYSIWRELPDEQRSPIRTYTVRAVRPELREIDVDMVVHEVGGGPASRWVARAVPGDELLIIGPDARSLSSAVGIDWQPGTATQQLLLGDETAAPAICSILETLPEGHTARAFIEVPTSADVLEPWLAPGASVTWLPRDGQPVGVLLEAALREWVAGNGDVIRPSLAASAQEVEEIDVDTQLLWDSPGAAPGAKFYSWIAGESAVIKTLRRFLVTETGIDRKRVAFMGYWRLGRAEGQ